MDARTPKLLVLFPGALGDFMCLLPALTALQIRFEGRVTVAAKPSLLEILSIEMGRFSIERREMADLFGTGLPHEDTTALLAGFTHVHSWTGYNHPGFAARLRSISAAHVEVHSFRAMRVGEHAASYYARCAGVQPRSSTLAVSAAEQEWAADVIPHADDPGSLLIHAGSGSVAKNWTGFAALAEHWKRHGHVRWLVGPADDEPNGVPQQDIIRNQPLPRIIALLRRVSLYVGNDSGISHLAGAAGTLGLALFAASDASVWRPLGLHVLHGGAPCVACGARRFCTHRLSVDVTEAALRMLLTHAQSSPNLLRQSQRRLRI
jgi:ADP-heptose:LPS heptosyltransferase